MPTYNSTNFSLERNKQMDSKTNIPINNTIDCLNNKNRYDVVLESVVGQIIPCQL